MAGSLNPLQTKADWDNDWEVGAEFVLGHPNTRPEVTLNYHWYVVSPFYREQAANFIRIFGWNADTRLLIVGCGFNWLSEILKNDYGLTSVVGVQESNYIQSEKTSNEDTDLVNKITEVGLESTSVEAVSLYSTFKRSASRSFEASLILNESLSDSQSRNRVRTLLGGNRPVILTHDGYLNTHTDVEAQALSANLSGLNPTQVIHHVYPNYLNAKTLVQWKTLLSNDTFIMNGTWNIL